MEATAAEEFAAGGLDGPNGTAAVHLRDERHDGQWAAAIRLLGAYVTEPGELNGRIVNNGESTDAHVAMKIAYARRSKADSGTSLHDVYGHESLWRGAVISADGNCICGYSGYPDERADVRISQAGIAEYERQLAQKQPNP
jgi:hypothetical protein